MPTVHAFELRNTVMLLDGGSMVPAECFTTLDIENMGEDFDYLK